MGILDNASGFRMANRKDEPIRMEIRPGLNSTNDAYFHFYDNNDTELYRMGLTAGSTFSIFDVVGGTELLSGGGVISSFGNYADTTVLKGLPTGAHTMFKSSDTVTDNQTIRIATRGYASSTDYVTAFYASNTLTATTLYIGGGTAATGFNAITHGRLSAGSGVGNGAGSTKIFWHDNGVNLGSAPAAPSGGRAVQISTTGQTNASYWADGNGAMYFPWDSAAAATAQIQLGSGQELRFYRHATVSNIFNTTGNLQIQNDGGNIIYDAAAGNTHLFKVNTVESAHFDLNGLVLPLDGTAANPNIICGAGTDLEVYAGAGNTVIWAHTGLFYLSNDSGQNIVLEAGHATTGDVVITTRAGTEVGRFDANGLVLPLDGAFGTPNLSMGIGGDFLFWFDSASSYIRSNGANLFLDVDTSGSIIHQVATTYKHHFRVNGVDAVVINDASATLLVDQTSATGAKPVLFLDQGDGDETFINFQGTIGADATSSISSWTTSGVVNQHLKVEVNGATRWIALLASPSA